MDDFEIWVDNNLDRELLILERYWNDTRYTRDLEAKEQAFRDAQLLLMAELNRNVTALSKIRPLNSMD